MDSSSHPNLRENRVNGLQTKVIMQGKLFQRCTHLLYCSVLSLGGNVHTRRMSQPDKGSIFNTKKNNEIFWSKETITLIIKIIKIKCFYPPRIVNNTDASILVHKFDQERTGFNISARRLYAIAINFPCLITLKCSHQPRISAKLPLGLK